MAQQPKGTVYLLHLEKPMNRAGHYLGWAKDLETRIAQHGTPRGAKMTRAAAKRGIGFSVVRTWNGTRSTERALKNLKDARSLCPHCCEARRDAKRFYGAMSKLGVRRITWN